ncbi:MAG: hypothetical protein M1819_003270 [Sarea resinae]|nr:MAG: hypothetical protein M1819_003270 [Sarea resinae]
MDNQSTANTSSPSSHRLPTVSASQALLSLGSSQSRRVSTGLIQIDRYLLRNVVQSENQPNGQGGLNRGQITEVYGPPGVGKTTLACQIASQRKRSSIGRPCGLGGYLVSLDTPLSSATVVQDVENLLEGFHHVIAPTLPHLIALLCHPTPSFPPPKTGLIVVDSISASFSTAFQKPQSQSLLRPEGKPKLTKKQQDAKQFAGSRRYDTMGDFVSKLGRLAATRNVAVLVTNQTVTRMRADANAALFPAVAGIVWDAGIASRICLFRDFPPLQDDGAQYAEENRKTRCAAVVKAGGLVIKRHERMAHFTINANGLRETLLQPVPAEAAGTPEPRKRKHNEVADSQSEDGVDSDKEYGWMVDEVDENLTEPQFEHDDTSK